MRSIFFLWLQFCLARSRPKHAKPEKLKVHGLNNWIYVMTGGDKSHQSHIFSGSAESYANDNGEKTALIRGLLKKL